MVTEQVSTIFPPIKAKLLPTKLPWCFHHITRDFTTQDFVIICFATSINVFPFPVHMKRMSFSLMAGCIFTIRESNRTGINIQTRNKGVVGLLTTITATLNRFWLLSSSAQGKPQSNLDSSVGIQFQYLRSSIPVIAIPFADIDMQTLPVTLSSHTSCQLKNPR